jgi:long-chain acyl-CoA synthetase
MNLATIIEPHPADAAAIISRGRTTTYGSLREDVARYRGGLVGLGLQPGERVGILAGTNWYFVATYLAVLGAGCVAVPLNPQNPPRAIERELEAIGAAAVFVGPAGRAAFGGVDHDKVPSLRHVIGPDDPDPHSPVDNGIARLGVLLTSEPTPIVERADDDLAVLVFTSGTAGSPKAAMLTHGNLRSNLEQVQSQPGRALTPDDVILGVLPLFHIFGLNVALGGALYVGASILLIERFDPTSALESMARHGVTVVLGAPSMWSSWTSMPTIDGAGFATVRLAGSGASKLDPEIASAARSRFGVDLTEGYGLTEASPVVTSAVGVGAKPGSIGAPLPGVEVRLVDPEGDDVLIGDPGELWVRGPNVFPGYWQDEDATAAALTDDGWLRTGDIAVVDDDGQLFIVDRAKDLIIVSGFNVYPAEVEEVLLEHPGIEAAAVIGVEHPHTGEAVKAYVVAAHADVEEDDVIAFCADRLSRYKCPSKVMFVDEIPTGLTGKILRRTLRD